MNENNDRHARDADGTGPSESIDTQVPQATFDEGGRKPSPITGTGDDNVRTAIPASSASTERITDEDEQRRHAQATMPPPEGNHPKRNTM